MSAFLGVPPAYAAARYPNAAVNYYNTPYRQGLRRALQRITCVAFAALDDNDYFTIQSVSDAKAFEFDVSANGVVPDRVAVGPFTGLEDAAGIAALVKAAIDSAAMGITTTLDGADVVLAHDLPGEVAALDDHVTDPAFVITHLNLGSDGDGFLPARWGLSRAFAPDGSVLS